MEMQKVIVVRMLPDPLQHRHMERVRIPDRTIDTERAWPHRLKPRRGHRVATRIQCDVVSECDQLLGEPMNDAFRAAIKLRWYGLRQRRNLGNVHFRNLHWSVTVPGSSTIRCRRD